MGLQDRLPTQAEFLVTEVAALEEGLAQEMRGVMAREIKESMGLEIIKEVMEEVTQVVMVEVTQVVMVEEEGQAVLVQGGN